MKQSEISTTTPTEVGSERLAQAVREACVRAAIDGYEQGGLSGLCADGRFDLAIDAIRALNLDGIVPDRTR